MPKHAPAKKADASTKPDKGKTANSKNASSTEPAPLSQKQLLFGVSFTGKTPLTLLYEYCQKRGWERPDVQSKQISGGKHTGIVYLKMRNPKDASVIDTVVMKPPDDSEVRIERSSGAEARHFAALYALYRFANNLNLKTVLPPLCRDYFVLLEKHKAETSKTKAFLWAADPFQAACPPPPAPMQSKAKKHVHPHSSELRLSQRALEEVEARSFCPWSSA
jgi:ATP-dependent RNA helicase DHX57